MGASGDKICRILFLLLAMLLLTASIVISQTQTCGGWAGASPPDVLCGTYVQCSTKYGTERFENPSTSDCQGICCKRATGTCGNGVIEPGSFEKCDGDNIDGKTCQSLGLFGDKPKCFAPGETLGCTFDTSTCQQCEFGECDGECCPPPSITIIHSPSGTNKPTTNDDVTVTANSRTASPMTIFVDNAVARTCASAATECKTESKKFAAGAHSYYVNVGAQTKAALGSFIVVDASTLTDITIPSGTSVDISIAVNEEKKLTIGGGTAPYSLETPCDGVKAICEVKQENGRWIFSAIGKQANSATYAYIKDSSSPFKTAIAGVTVTTAATTCGNGLLEKNLGEECDGTNLDAKDCSMVGSFTGGNLGCKASSSSTPCKFDTSACTTTSCTSTGVTCNAINGKVCEFTHYSNCAGKCTLYCNDGCTNNKCIGGGSPCDPSSKPAGACTTQGQTYQCVNNEWRCAPTVGTGLCTPILNPAPQINYGPYDVNNLQEEKKRAWRISICFQPPQKSNPTAFKQTMDNWVAAYNQAFDPDIQRKPGGSETTDAILFKQDGLVDVIEGAGTSNPKWTYDPITETTNAKCGNGRLDGTEECDSGPPMVFKNSATCRSLRFDSGTLDCHDSGDDACTYDTEGCFRTTTSSCDDVNGKTPSGISVSPNSAKNNDFIRISGNDLTRTVQFITQGNVNTYSEAGSVNSACTQTTIMVPSYLSPGRYTLKIRRAEGKVSEGVEFTVQSNTCGTLKYTPDGASSGYCNDCSQCLADPNAVDESKRCISPGQYSGDNFCLNTGWTSRTKLLALKMLKLKTADYILFCDNKENTLNNLQYIVASNQAASSLVDAMGANDFCVLKNSNNVIVGTVLNKDLSTAAGSTIVFGAANCNNAMAADGQFHPCETSNKVWYNKNLNSIIISGISITVPSEQEGSNFIVDLFRPIIEAIKRLISGAPHDQAYLDKITRFHRLYLSSQGTKSILGSIEGTDYVTAAIKYRGFPNNFCSSINEFARLNNDTTSGISCKNEAGSHYILAQGSQSTALSPDSIWADLTAKLRIP